MSITAKHRTKQNMRNRPKNLSIKSVRREKEKQKSWEEKREKPGWWIESRMASLGIGVPTRHSQKWVSDWVLCLRFLCPFCFFWGWGYTSLFLSTNARTLLFNLFFFLWILNFTNLLNIF